MGCSSTHCSKDINIRITLIKDIAHHTHQLETKFTSSPYMKTKGSI